ncbi:MAG: class I SAM-dependent methyltransferase [Firmicutes bacterium]|nr:class I SAM-dependent methyltransferase [Bacillota bacterium]
MSGLTGRLARIAQLVGHAHTLADIGSDHGLLPIALLQTGRIARAIAIEISEGPHQAVSRAIADAGVNDRMEARLGDGCAPLSREEADVVVIAGMGGHTIWTILTAPATRQTFASRPPRLILQPMNGTGLIRFWAQQAGYRVREDVRVKEGALLYECLALDPPVLDRDKMWVGPTEADHAQYEALSAELRMRYLCGEAGLHMRCQLLAWQVQVEIAKRQRVMHCLAYPLADRAKERLMQIRQEYGALLRLQDELAVLQGEQSATP